MAYTYYQQSNPSWGTSQFQLCRPPAPTFQPEATWNGWDYYRAHAVNPDPSLFFAILPRTRDVASTTPFSSSEVRAWHRRIYGGLINPNQVLPSEIGSAAAYEAYRTWKYHTSIYQVLGGHTQREREALTGLAVAEASRLWQYSGRPMDTMGLRDALESAALTASQLYDRKLSNVTRDIGIPSATISPPIAVAAGLAATTFPTTDPTVYAKDYAYADTSYPARRRRHSSVPSVIRTGPNINPPYGDGRSVRFPPSPGVPGGGLMGDSYAAGGLRGRSSLTPPSRYSSPYSGTPYAPPNASGLPLQGGTYGGIGAQVSSSIPAQGGGYVAPAAGGPMYSQGNMYSQGGVPEQGTMYSRMSTQGSYPPRAAYPHIPNQGVTYAQASYPGVQGGTYPNSAIPSQPTNSFPPQQNGMLAQPGLSNASNRTTFGSGSGASTMYGSSSAYPQAPSYPYPAQASGMPPVANAPPGVGGNTSIIEQPRRSRSRVDSTSSGHHHHHRSRSMDPIQGAGSGMGFGVRPGMGMGTMGMGGPYGAAGAGAGVPGHPRYY